MSGYRIVGSDGAVTSLHHQVFTYEEPVAQVYRLPLPADPPESDWESVQQGSGNRKWCNEFKEWADTAFTSDGTFFDATWKELLPLLLQSFVQDERQITVEVHRDCLEVPARLTCSHIGKKRSWPGAYHSITRRSGATTAETLAFAQEWLDTYADVLRHIRQKVEAAPFHNYFR